MTFDEYSASPSAREKMALFSAKRKRREKIYLCVTFPLLIIAGACSIAAEVLDTLENSNVSLTCALLALGCLLSIFSNSFIIKKGQLFLRELYPAERLLARDKLSAFFGAFPKEGNATVKYSLTEQSLVLEIEGGETCSADITFFAGALRMADVRSIFLAGYFPLMDENRSRGYFLNELKLVPSDIEQKRGKKEKGAIYYIKKGKFTYGGKSSYADYLKAEERYEQTKNVEM